MTFKGFVLALCRVVTGLTTTIALGFGRHLVQVLVQNSFC